MPQNNAEIKIWEDIPNYIGLYQISIFGEVKSLRSNKTLKKSTKKSGYYQISLCNKGVQKEFLVHKLMAITFLNYSPDKSRKTVIDHIDNNPKNNLLSNLQIISQRENASKDKNTNYTGVYKASSGNYAAHIRINGKLKYLGTFPLEKQASNAYKSALKNIKYA